MQTKQEKSKSDGKATKVIDQVFHKIGELKEEISQIQSQSTVTILKQQL